MKRFELDEKEITQRDGVLYISVTAFHEIPGSAIATRGLSHQITGSVYRHFWRYKGGHLLAMEGLDWLVFTERNEETDLVLAAVARWEENKAKAAHSGE